MCSIPSRVITMLSSSLSSVLTKTTARVIAMTALVLTFPTILTVVAEDSPTRDVAKPVDQKAVFPKPDETAPVIEKAGVLINDSRACPGYNLINPGRKQTYLYDNEGHVVHTWTSEHSSGAAVYLLDNGHLFRPAEAVDRKPGFQGPAAGGRIQ